MQCVKVGLYIETQLHFKKPGHIMKCIFATDLHGRVGHYETIFNIVRQEKPDALFLGGDLLPGGAILDFGIEEFLTFFQTGLGSIKDTTGTKIFLILGNDDPRSFEDRFIEADRQGLIEYVHFRTVTFGDLFVTGYSYIPPTPFLLKDWEKYDVSRYVDPGCVSPEEGRTTSDRPEAETGNTIHQDLEELAEASPPEKTIYLFHAPPYNSVLDRADLDNKFVDHAPIDPHIGSEAVARFKKKKNPILTLHGHVHETARLSGNWRETNGAAHSFSAAHDGGEVCVVSFDTADLINAKRRLIGPNLSG